jgi:putative membrane protein
MRVALCAMIMAASAIDVAAHGQSGLLEGDPRIFSVWDQAILVALLIAGVVYWRGASRLPAPPIQRSRRRYAAFAVGWLALVAAILPWFDAAAVRWFSAHMAQHELMMLIGAPLITAGRPLSTCLWAMPLPWRKRCAWPLQHAMASRAVAVATAPVVAWALHGVALWIWHVPVLYEWAVRSEAAHAVQHSMFVGTSMLFWGGLVNGRYGRAGYGAAVFFVFVTAVHTGILGALFTLAGVPLYPIYGSLPGVTTETALADQQLAGLVMWIPAGILLTVMGIALFAAWLGESERRMHASPLGRSRASRT